MSVVDAYIVTCRASLSTRSPLQVTIVDMANVILPGFAAACAQYTLKWLQRHGVELRLGEAIATIEDTSITLKSGVP